MWKDKNELLANLEKSAFILTWWLLLGFRHLRNYLIHQEWIVLKQNKFILIYKMGKQWLSMYYFFF